MDAAELVCALYRAYQERAWERAAELLSGDATVVMPATAERLVGREAVIGWQHAYPEPWGDVEVEEVVAGADPAVAAAQVRVVDPEGRHFAMAAFWRADEGLLRTGVEYWVTVGGEDPPPNRSGAAATEAARAAWRDQPRGVWGRAEQAVDARGADPAVRT